MVGRGTAVGTLAGLSPEQATPEFLWLDLTRKCQLKCVHCYNTSGPDGTHGTMTREHWISVLDQAADCGVRRVQLIGGEPALYPHAAELLTHALSLGLHVECFSNLVHVPDEWWDLFMREGVSLATSYYSDRAGEHDAITGRRSHARTRANIEKAARLGIPLRVGIIGDNEQRIDAARRDLESLGVTRIGADYVRAFGRGAQGQVANDPANLCGGCGTGRASIGPNGEVSPCVFSGWMGVGNVQDAPLAAVLSGGAMAEANRTIRQAVRRAGHGPERMSGAGHGDPQCYPDQAPCFPAQSPCTPDGHVPPACSPDDGECSPGYESTFCNPRR
jgi:MoaA/NifB/PqqE/SkfB family radical SAM enzyme